MKTKLTRLIAIGGACIGFSTSLNAVIVNLAVGDQYSIGLVIDGIPSNLANEVDYINTLINPTLVPLNTTVPLQVGTEQYTRTNNTWSPLPTALLADAVKTDTSNTGVDLGSGVVYLLGKYDQAGAGAYVWYVAGLTEVTLPATLNGHELSHWSTFNPAGSDAPTPIPDGGLTAIMLGLALCALEFLRRRANA